MLHKARGQLAMGDGWAWYQRLAKKWGTNHLSPTMAEAVASGKPISASEYAAAAESADEAKSRLLSWFAKYDVLICPVAENAATPIDWDPSIVSKGSFLTDVGAFNSTGWPVAVVRCGSSADGRLPIGVQIVAAPWREDVALAVARYLEGRSGGWRPAPI